jgi:hypothetical protein
MAISLFSCVSRGVVAPLREVKNVSRQAATTLRDGFINFHHSSYFFIVAP